MAALSHLLRALLIPLAAATLLYLVTTLLLLPFIRRHRTRYTPYLPLSSITTHTTTWRTTLSDALYNLFVPGSWRRAPVHDDESSFDDDEGEGMVGFEGVERVQRQAREGERLGRELEVGFRDDSESEDDIPVHARARI